MKFKFKKNDIVRIKILPDNEYLEYSPDFEDFKLKKGMKGKINVILPNGKYHIEIMNDKDEIVAYAPFDESQIEEY